MKLLIILLSLLLVVSAPFFGQIPLSLENIWDTRTTDYQIFWDIRVPKTLLAFLTGGILSVGGLIFQSVFKNPMGTPFTLGVASGATLFTAIGIILGFSSFISLFAFVGALLTIIILFLITNRLQNIQTTTLLLIGIALSFFYSAALMVMFFLSDLSQSYEIVRFTMGSLDTVGFKDTGLLTFGAIFMLIIIKLYMKEFKLLLISDQFAQLKGINTQKVNYILLFGVSVAVGICVSITGPIGFIGLIVPHILKTIYKRSSDKLIFPIFIYGGVFLVFCDLLSRNLGGTSDIPIGVITSFLGAPFFIYLIMRRDKF